METAGIPGYSKPADRSQNASGHSPSAEPATRTTSAASESEDAIYLDATTGVAGSAGARMPRLLSSQHTQAIRVRQSSIATQSHTLRSPKSLYYFSYYNRPDRNPRLPLCPAALSRLDQLPGLPCNGCAAATQSADRAALDPTNPCRVTGRRSES